MELEATHLQFVLSSELLSSQVSHLSQKTYEKVLTWQRVTSTLVGPPFCAEQLYSWFWPQTALLNWRCYKSSWCFPRAGQWFYGYMVLWQVGAQVAVSGIKHWAKGPSKWQERMKSERSQNDFSLWRIGELTCGADRLLLQLEGGQHPSGHTVGAQVSFIEVLWQYS